MDRPPRSARPLSSQPQPPQPAYDQQPALAYNRDAVPSFPDQTRSSSRQRPQQQPLQSSFDSSKSSSTTQQANVSFQATAPVRPERQRTMPSPYAPAMAAGVGGAGYDPESQQGADFGRKKSLVRPDREKIEPGHRQWHYRNAAAQAEEEGMATVGVMASSTGNKPLRRGRSLLAREEDVHESGLALFKRATLHRKRPTNSSGTTPGPNGNTIDNAKKNRRCLGDIGPGPKGPWMVYCWLLTCLVPPVLMRMCGLRSPEQQRAWREKMGLVSIILILMAGVGFLTFGFTEAVCGTPPNRFQGGSIGNSSVIIHGYDYDFSNFKHPAAGSVFNGQTNPLIQGNWGVAGGDASFMFQNVNQNCFGLITKASNSSITGSGGNLDWYFPCNAYNQYGTSGQNLTGYQSNTNCHVSSTARGQLTSMNPLGQVYYTWENLTNPKRNLAVFESSVLDLNLLSWLSPAQVSYPSLFDELKKGNGLYNGKDLSMNLLRTDQRVLGQCLQDIITVGFIDTKSIGCVASQVVLILSLVFIIGVVSIRFGMAVMFAWFFSWKLGNFPRETYEERMARSAAIENWTNDIYKPAPSQYRPNVGKNGLRQGKNNRKTFLPSTSRFTPAENVLKGANPRPSTAYGMLDGQFKRPATMYTASSTSGGKKNLTPPDTPGYRQSRSTMMLNSDAGSTSHSQNFVDNPCPFPLQNVVPQPATDYEPFNFPLAHTICLVTAYSESVEGLRTTLDSLATTDYPNSHKLILVIADGNVKGSGNSMTTPEICLTMMKELIIQPQDVEPHSYVAISDGHKRHNMAKVYAGFYDYDDATLERSKQQRVPIVLVAKVGNPLEANDPKPGNRGKRDSQIVLMAFLQKVMFDERMTTFEYEFFNSLWRVTGVSPDRYELVLCIDADTKAFPDSITRMVSCMVHDEEIMGLCGETKIANKAETFVTMIQVFEYYISHHMTKAFESMFGGVTCLPGCFSMYRIKAPKGDSGYWVPILANPDIVEHYSENVVDTLHKKNLLLLGEDRYLTTLMLKTFPKRKNIFCPQAVCKTVVPDTFRVLISQRRRWINSTVHNLAELLLVRDLCGTFCFSMQFVVGMELAGTLVLPAAIAFTLYLIVQSIIPGGVSTTIPLILLGIVLGLPGLLIVITSRKVAYIGWMLIYLISLPIWNGLLPAYAFWHFDDFSWGNTRLIEESKEDNHGDKEGEFDATHIVMKRWAEFERDRRWKSGTQSRDSTVFDRKTESNRYSMASNSDNYHPGSGGFDSSTMESSSPLNNQRPRHDSNALLMLPAPLAGLGRPATGSSTGLSRSSEDAYMSDIGSSSNQRLIPSPGNDQYSDSFEAPTPRYPVVANPSVESQISRTADKTGAVLRNATLSSQYPGETQNPFRHSAPHTAGYEGDHMTYSAELEEYSASPTTATPLTRREQLQARGVSLSDNGPVPGPERVRRVSRQATKAPRPQSQTPPNQNRYSRGSTHQLPPGAAPPQPGGYGGGYS